MAGFRNRDMKVERELARFMDNHLYNDGRFSEAKRTDSVEEQLSGSDIILSIPSLNVFDIVVDEKGQTQYMKNPLPTFTLELSFLNGDKEIRGWFLDDEKKTQYYMFIWPKAKKEWNATCEDIIEVDYVLVSKQSLREYFESKGLSKEKLIEKNNLIRKANQTGIIEKGEEDYWFFYSNQLVEKPINIVLRKRVYESLALMKGTISL